MRILCVVGTRPNFIKMAALYHEMKKRKSFEPVLVHTGQHYDANMSRVFFTELELPEPDIDLNVSGGSHTYQTSLIMERFESVVQDVTPDLMIVVGDVNSTLAASIVASQCGIPLAHVEAGLRSGDRGMPEEINRILVDHIADFLFVTEQSGIDNLQKEGISEDKIFFVGNVMVDTLLANREKAQDSDVLNRLGLSRGRYAVVTLHRPSNSDDRDALSEILYALCEISRELTVVLPIHPRTRKRMDEFGLLTAVESESGIILTEPLGYLDFLYCMSEARMVLTDSGGIQEETTILGVPCITVRNNTERPVTIESGTNTLAGTRGDDIISAYRSLPDVSRNQLPHPPLWDGKASERIIDVLERKAGSSAS
ncbi:non-hydrolyzing UDP-N-acetylglucosamine 2-epimerase [Candidatus Latescibacterota bacterium]